MIVFYAWYVVFIMASPILSSKDPLPISPMLDLLHPVPHVLLFLGLLLSW